MRHIDKRCETSATGAKSAKHASKKTKSTKQRTTVFLKQVFGCKGRWKWTDFCVRFFTSRIQSLHTCLAITQVSQDDWTQVIASKNGVRASYLISSIVLGKNCHSVYCSQRHTRFVCHIYFLKNCTVYIYIGTNDSSV